ncbi:hypothetical protein P8452_06948 [Trifolium repens]|nr:hypothetical protein P8452_06948 [Trifolium repens]
MITTIACNILQVELEKPFDRPYLSTSLQEFWGKRWNVMVSRILHPTIYKPMVKAFSHFIGRNARMPYGRLGNHVGIQCFSSSFMVFVALQIAYKKTFKPKQQLLPRIVSCTLTMAFVMTTALTLFIPVFFRFAER